MIIFNSIHITSFKSIFDVEFDFNVIKGNFYSLEGKNNTSDFATSNGAGKSTLIDALSYVLYGTTTGIYIKKDEYQNKNSKIPLKIVLDFDINVGDYKGNYQLTRTLNQILLVKNGEDISEDAKTQTEKKLAEILNLTKEEFFSFTYLAQNTSSSFLGKTASEKLSVIKDFIFGEELSQIKNKIDSKIKDIKSSIQQVKLDIAKLSGNIESIEKIQSTSSNFSEEDLPTKEEISNNEALLKQLENSIKEKRVLENEKSKLELEYNSLKLKMATLKEQMKHIKNNICPTCGQALHDNSVENKVREEASEIKSKASEVANNIKNLAEKLSEQTPDLDYEHKKLLNLIQNQKLMLERHEAYQSLGDGLEKQKQELQVKNQDLVVNEFKLKQLTSLQKYFNTTFIQYVQQAFLSEIERYLNLYCYEVFDKPFSLRFNNNNLDLCIGGCPYSYFSGGERQRIDFLFVFAIKVALSNFTDKCTNLLCFDESLSAQDGTAFENCIELISRLSASNDLTTILVSHRENSNVSPNKIVIERYDNRTDLSIFNNT